MTNSSPSETALALAALGVSIFPCHARTGESDHERPKRPKPGINWRAMSSSDERRVASWWERWPDAVAGIDLAKSGWLVIDCDVKGHADGLAAFQALAERHGGDLSGVPCVRTPSGGAHYYFRNEFEPPHGNARGALPAGIDVRGHGGYVIAPGFRIESGLYDGALAAPAPLPDWLRLMLRPTVQPAATPVSVERAPSAPGDREAAYIEEAIAQECARMSGAGEGERNNTLNECAFSLATIPALTAQRIANALGPIAVAAGLPHAEVAATLRSAIKAGQAKPRQWPPEELRPARAVVMDISGLLADAETGEIIEDEPDEEPIFTGEITKPPGLLGDLAQWIVDTARRPQPALALGAALTILGTAAGRHMSGPTRSGTHLYVIGLAKSGRGKDHPAACIPQIMMACQMGPHLGPSEFISMPAALNFLCRAPLSVCAMDEFGAFLKRVNARKASSFETAITKVLRTAWGSSFRTMMTPEWAGREAQPICSPSLSIFGVSTPEEFYDALSGMDANNGTLNRFLILEAPDKPSDREPIADPATVPDAIRDGLRYVYDRAGLMAPLTSSHIAPEAYQIPWASERVAARFAEASAEIEDQIERDRDIEKFMARTAEMAIRLATIRAIGCDPYAPEVGHADLEWGLAIAFGSARSMIKGAADYMSDTEHQANAKLVLSVVRDHKRLTRNQLTRKLDHRLNRRDLDGIMGLLEEAGQIEVLKARSEGADKPTTWVVYRG